MSQPQVIIMRGAPGSGKSTEALRIGADALAEGKAVVICSNDHYTMIDGKYCWQADKAKEYSERCFSKFVGALCLGRPIDLVIVDNTNITAKDFTRYVQYAKERGYDVEFREPQTSWWLAYRDWLGEDLGSDSADYFDKLESLAYLCEQHCSHSVPYQTILNMLCAWTNCVGLTRNEDYHDLP